MDIAADHRQLTAVDAELCPDVVGRVLDRAVAPQVVVERAVHPLVVEPKRMWIPGDWMSVSTMPTRLPMRAIETARLAVVFDLPVPPGRSGSR